MLLQNSKIAIIGLGYVGLPLAVEFAKKYPVVGFDINERRIKELNSGIDHTLEVDVDLLKSVLKGNAEAKLNVSKQKNDLIDCNVFIITVPTPTDKNNHPDLTPLYKASETVGSVLKKNDIVIYESTVYPGVTEDECVPVLEKISGLKFNVDFFAGYSPERINPGDKEHTVSKILKVTSGSTPEIAELIDQLYQSIIIAGTFKASSIKVAEAAKVIENSQRDINIAFVNELSKIFHLLNIDTNDVLAAAGTKWNFLPFKPGLVGGHCIGVDPYYLALKAQQLGYHPEIILAGRRLNDGMGSYIANEIVKLLIKKGNKIKEGKVLILGISFKENCPDIRNTKVIDIINALKDYDIHIDVYDPWANHDEVLHEYGIKLIDNLAKKQASYDTVVLAVAHEEFKHLAIREFVKENGIVYDIKNLFHKTLVDARL
ncbi:nucleotide sugar dehydrogenase [Flavobacterium sp.]|uniref:nucleotide sugar dehydrogenase n=1 Tax=Flavobacterium sp. TaxID=239 RepID=UPI003BD79874